MSGVETVMIASAAAGAGASIYGQISAAEASAEAARRNSDIKRIQATELLERQAINEGIMREQAEREQLAYGAREGVANGGLGGILQMRADLEESIVLSRRDAEFKARMLKAGADIETDLASDAVTAAYITGAGTALSFGSKMYGMYAGPTKSKPLPEV